MATTADKILVIGHGELGSSVLDSLLSHPSYAPSRASLALTLRPSTLSQPPSESKAAELARLQARGIALLPLDLTSISATDLTALLRSGGFTTVIHASGMLLPPGAPTKLTHAVLAAGCVRLFLPWQFGVDYDELHAAGGAGARLFDEQYRIRELLRAQKEVGWVVLSCGIFMSFLFEEVWGVVHWGNADRDESGSEQHRRIDKVRAFGGWENKLAISDAKDIGRAVAELVLDESGRWRNRITFMAGETLSHAQIADAVDAVQGGSVERELWDLDYLKEEVEREPGDKLKLYRVAFGSDVGLHWSGKAETQSRDGSMFKREVLRDGTEEIRDEKKWNMVKVKDWLRERLAQ